MIDPVIRAVIAAAALAWAGCAVESAPAATAATADLTGEAARGADSVEPPVAASQGSLAPEDVTALIAPASPVSCGYECHTPTSDILGVPWRFCLHNCPGGPSNCTPMPPPPCP
jgi:hypothetical protein